MFNADNGCWQPKIADCPEWELEALVGGRDVERVRQ